MTLIIHDNKYILMTIIIGGYIYIHVLMKQPVGDAQSRGKVQNPRLKRARLIMHTHIVTQFLVRGGSIYQ